MLTQIKKFLAFAKTLPKAFWIGLVALLTYLAISARKTAQAVVEIERKRSKERQRQIKRAAQIAISLDRTKKEIEKKEDLLEEETLKEQKKVAEAATSMKKTSDLVNETFEEK